MIEIPLFNNGAQPKVQGGNAPALDRGRAIQVNYSDLTAKAQVPLMSDATAKAAAEGGKAWGQALQTLGQVAGAMAEKQIELQNYTDRIESDGMMHRALSDFMIEAREANLHPGEWRARWDAKLETLRSQVLHDKLTGSGRQLIEADLTRFSGRSQVEVAEMAFKETRQRATSTAISQADLAYDAGDIEGGDRILTHAAEQGLLYDDQATDRKLRGRKLAEAKLQEETFKAELSILQDDPKAWMEQHKERGDMDPVVYDKLKIQARQEMSERTAAAVDELTAGIFDGTLTVPGEVDALESEWLTPEIREKAKELIDRRGDDSHQKWKEENAIPNFIELRQAVKDYDREKDTNGGTYAALRLRISDELPEPLVGEIAGPLYQKYAGKPIKIEPKKSVTALVRDSLDSMRDEGLFGNYKEHAFTPNGTPTEVVNEPAYRRARELQAEVEGAMTDWLERNPDATPAKAREKLMQLLPEKARSSLLDSFMQPASASLDDDLIGMVKELEGFYPEAYGDFKQYSVGYGTKAKSEDEKITKEEADARLREELSGHAKRVDAAASEKGLKLTKAQRNALISFDFNTGRGAHLIETSSDLAEIKRRMLLYTKAGGKDLPGLVSRRKKEAELFDL